MGGGAHTPSLPLSLSLSPRPCPLPPLTSGSFGDAGGFAANLIASSDQSFRLRGRRPADPVAVQTASLLDARAVTAPNGGQVYRVDYLLKRAGEEAPRTFYTAVALGPDPNGRGFTAALYPVTAQATAAALAGDPGLGAALAKAADSFVPPVAERKAG